MWGKIVLSTFGSLACRFLNGQWYCMALMFAEYGAALTKNEDMAWILVSAENRVWERDLNLF